MSTTSEGMSANRVTCPLRYIIHIRYMPVLQAFLLHSTKNDFVLQFICYLFYHVCYKIMLCSCACTIHVLQDRTVENTREGIYKGPSPFTNRSLTNTDSDQKKGDADTST